MPPKTKQKIKRIVHFQILSVFAFSIALSSSHLTALASSDSPISPVVLLLCLVMGCTHIILQEWLELKDVIR
ncbi:MAG: hypothetical protein WCH00_00440 [Candidatus Saccharibacteria bacterium]